MNVKSQSELDIGGRETCLVIVVCSRQLELLLGLPGEQKQLLPGPEGRDSDLLELLISQGGEGLEVDLVAEEDICVLAQTLGGQQRGQLIQARGDGLTCRNTG